MKKIYMTPSVSIVSVNTQQIIAASTLEQTNNGNNAEVDITTTDEGYGGGFCSNGGYSVWKDDEEDEEYE